MLRVSIAPPKSQECHALVAPDLVIGPPSFGTPTLGHIEAPHSREVKRRSNGKAHPRSGAARGEGDDAYPIIARIDGKHRVIECADRLQWVVQTREGRRWRSLSFHRDRDALIARSGATGAALAILRALPEQHG